MAKFYKFISQLKRANSGVTALEYGLIAAVIGGVVITGATAMGGSLGSVFTTIATALTNA